MSVFDKLFSGSLEEDRVAIARAELAETCKRAGDMLHKAAEEITRLRAENQQLRADRDVAPTPLLLTPEQAASRLGLGRTRIFALLASGEIESVLIDRSRRIRPDALEAYVARLRR